MTDDLRTLYQDVILEHWKKPRNFRALPDADRTAEGFNPLCGDEVTIYLRMEGDRVKDVAFQGSGCAISTASASVMTTVVKGKTLAEIEEVFGQFHRMVMGTESPNPETMGKLAVFGGVSEFPVRVKCASLAWHTLNAALQGEDEPVTTE